MNLCRYVDCLKNYDDYLEINIIKRLGPVLLGSKPIHVFCFNNGFHFKEAILAEFDILFNSVNHIQHVVINANNNSTKVVVINENNLMKTMADEKIIKFLNLQGYQDLNDFTLLAELCIDLEKNILKPVMGILFGYPLKDVIGFIGHRSLKLNKIKGWQMYGDLRLSEMVYNHFVEKENIIVECFTEKGIQGIKDLIAA